MFELSACVGTTRQTRVLISHTPLRFEDRVLSRCWAASADITPQESNCKCEKVETVCSLVDTTKFNLASDHYHHNKANFARYNTSFHYKLHPAWFHWVCSSVVICQYSMDYENVILDSFTIYNNNWCHKLTNLGTRPSLCIPTKQQGVGGGGGSPRGQWPSQSENVSSFEQAISRVLFPPVHRSHTNVRQIIFWHQFLLASFLPCCPVALLAVHQSNLSKGTNQQPCHNCMHNNTVNNTVIKQYYSIACLIDKLYNSGIHTARIVSTTFFLPSSIHAQCMVSVEWFWLNWLQVVALCVRWT